MLILFEGGESVGKTTNSKRLEARLKRSGLDALYVREPGGDRIAESIRGVLLDPDHKGLVAPLAELFLFLASRAQVLEHIVRPALARGTIVVLDRYSLSTMAYQIAGRGLPLAQCLSALDLATSGLVPDRTFLLTCTYETSCERQKADGKRLDRFELEDSAFHRRVIEAYHGFAGILPSWNIHHVRTDALTPDQVFIEILTNLDVPADVLTQELAGS
jgi:dTMP kinase